MRGVPRPIRQRRDHRHQGRPEAAGDRRRAAAARDRLARGQPGDELVDGQVAETHRRFHATIVGRGPTHRPTGCASCSGVPSPAQPVRAQGGAEERSERTRMCVSEHRRRQRGDRAGSARRGEKVRWAGDMRPPSSRTPEGVDGEEPRLPKVVRWPQAARAAGTRSSRAWIVQRRERCWYVSAEPHRGRVDLVERAGTGDRGVGALLVADRDEARDRDALLAPRDLARGAMSPIGADLDLDGCDADHRHLVLLVRRMGRRQPGHFGCERLFSLA